MTLAVSYRLAALPRQLHIVIQTRLSSTSSGSSDRSAPQFPFPTHARPSPHQIFHLPLSATQQDVKQRCVCHCLRRIKWPSFMFNLLQPSNNSDYALVRLHHPDSPSCRLHTPSPAERHARFQAISAAYDTLRLKSNQHSHHYYGDQPFGEELEARRRAYHRHHSRMHHRQAEYTYHREWQWGPGGQANPDDRWKDRAIVAIGLLVCPLPSLSDFGELKPPMC